jgi:hypothetical protein
MPQGIKTSSLTAYLFSHAAECWHNLRMLVFEADRILRITRKRRALDAPREAPRRYPWMSDPHLSFDWDD